MKRYWLFGGSTYYPCGGMMDFVDSFDTLGEATESHAGGSYNEWAHILDCETKAIVMVRNESTAWHTPTEHEKAWQRATVAALMTPPQ